MAKLINLENIDQVYRYLDRSPRRGEEILFAYMSVKDSFAIALMEFDDQLFEGVSIEYSWIKVDLQQTLQDCDNNDHRFIKEEQSIQDAYVQVIQDFMYRQIKKIEESDHAISSC